METTIKTDVLIVGAGPTGLSFACQLVRYGVDFRIVEKRAGVTEYSKAVGVQARTLEIYDQIGLADKAVTQGSIAEKARLMIDGEMRGELDFSNIGEGLSPYPFVLMLEQSKNEKLLYDYLQNHQIEILWNTELESFTQNVGDEVTAQIKFADGTTQTIEAKYLIGCDGPKSPTRHAFGIEFVGGTFERVFYVADALIDWKLPHDAIHICFAENSFVVFFPLKGERRYRIVGAFPEEFSKDEGDVLYEEIEDRIREESKMDFDITHIEWFSSYKVRTLHADKFSKGRCFLAGDAAHVHTPAGAQGMNTGIQDGYNLAWKLAFVLQEKADEKLLETYNEERLENAKHLLKTTDRLFEFAAGTNPILDFVRMNIFPTIANYILGFDTVKNFVFPMISQIGINYRHSTLSRHAGDEEFSVKAGDRMPYFQMNGESVFSFVREPRFHFLIFTNEETDYKELFAEIENAGLWIKCRKFSLLPEIEDLFGTKDAFSVLLRPDNHIGFITKEISLNEIIIFYQNFLVRR